MANICRVVAATHLSVPLHRARSKATASGLSREKKEAPALLCLLTVIMWLQSKTSISPVFPLPFIQSAQRKAQKILLWNLPICTRLATIVTVSQCYRVVGPTMITLPAHCPHHSFALKKNILLDENFEKIIIHLGFPESAALFNKWLSDLAPGIQNYTGV